MKEKRGYFSKAEKNDENPFAGYLYEDEKILWMDGARGIRVPNDRKTFGILSLTALIIWVTLVSQYRDMSVVVSTTGACVFLIALIYGLTIFWKPSQSPTQASSKGIYALTNRHLFYWDGESVTEVALEEVPEMLLIPGKGSQGTLTFANVIPAMTNVDDAIYVKTMIDQARKRRLEEEGS